MNVIQPPFWVRWFYSGSIWRKPEREKIVYLTFDDGPVPEPTSWVLNELKSQDIKATFFCIGDNAEKNPGLLDQVRSEGHSVGNHTQNHLNGWNTPLDKYLENVESCSRSVTSELFRPPYGRLTWRQFRALQKKYRIVFWDVLSMDYDKELSGADCIRNVMEYVRPGSVIVFHDSLKALDRLKVALPEVVSQLKAKGFRFELL